MVKVVEMGSEVVTGPLCIWELNRCLSLLDYSCSSVDAQHLFWQLGTRIWGAGSALGVNRGRHPRDHRIATSKVCWVGGHSVGSLFFSFVLGSNQAPGMTSLVCCIHEEGRLHVFLLPAPSLSGDFYQNMYWIKRLPGRYSFTVNMETM